MRSKSEIVSNWLPRYTGVPLEEVGDLVLLTNFGHYLEVFAKQGGVEVRGRDRPMPNARFDGITMINFGMGSANAATVMDLLSAVSPRAVLFLGKLRQSEARGLQTTTCCPKSRRCRPSVCSAQSQR